MNDISGIIKNILNSPALIKVLNKLYHVFLFLLVKYPIQSAIAFIIILIFVRSKLPDKTDHNCCDKKNTDDSDSFLKNPCIIALMVIFILSAVIKGGKVSNSIQAATENITADYTADIQKENIPQTNQDFINLIAELAKDNNKNIFKSVLIAQAIHESQWGKSGLAKNHNNLFGIKAGKEWSGASINMSTNEEYSGKVSTIKDNFRKYNSWETSILDYINFLNVNDNYKNAGVLNAKTPEQQITAIKDGGYATDSKYVTSIVNIINEYNLKVFDKLNELPVQGEITSYFGSREAPTNNASTDHKGIDIAANTGTKIKSLIGGKITKYEDSKSGKYVIIKNGSYEEVFCHMSKIYNLDNINPGEYIGEAGNTGTSTGSHLHFGFKINGVYVDPLKYISYK